MFFLYTDHILYYMPIVRQLYQKKRVIQLIYLKLIIIFSFINKKNSWQRPILAFTIVGAEWLNFCVRDGNRCTSLAIVTKKNILRNNSLKT